MLGIAAVAADRYAPYHLPRIKGTFARQQLRLLLGTEAFSKVMAEAHSRFAGREIDAASFVALAGGITRRPLAAFFRAVGLRTRRG